MASDFVVSFLYKYFSPNTRLKYLNGNKRLRACLHRGGGPQVGELTRRGLPHLPRVPHLHVNRPLKMRKNNSFVQLLAVITSQNYIIYEKKKQRKSLEMT